MKEEIYQLDPSKCVKVQVRVSESDEWEERYLIAICITGCITVDGSYEEEFVNNEEFKTIYGRYWRPIPKEEHRPFESLEEFEPYVNWWFKYNDNYVYKIDRVSASGIITIDGWNTELKELINQYTMSPTLTGEYIKAGVKV